MEMQKQCFNTRDFKNYNIFSIRYAFEIHAHTENIGIQDTIH